MVVMELMDMQRLKALREFVGMTQEELAEILGCHPNSIQAWESGNTVPSGGNRLKLEALMDRWSEKYEMWKNSLD